MPFVAAVVLASPPAGSADVPTSGSADVPTSGAADVPSVVRAGPVAKAVCVNCHGWRKTRPERRALMVPHDRLVVAHGGDVLWCLDCHAVDEPAKLVADGGTVPFEQADRQCARCHGARVRDWGLGIHGRRVGGWVGDRGMLRCPACHDPHRPAWRPSVPDRPPLPRRIESVGSHGD
ncbi:MAG: hypothetical protein ABT940_09235 [Alphaproteobacteria bacterium]